LAVQQAVSTSRRDWVRWVAGATIVAAMLILLAGPLHRLGIDFRPLFAMMRYAAIAAGVGALVCAVAVFVTRKDGDRRPFRLAILGLVAGLLAFVGPLMLLAKAQSVPRIHDISTDTLDPPQFVAVLPLRAGAMNPPEYAGPSAAAQQTAAYPTIRTLVLDVPPDQAYSRALAAAAAMGWDIVAAVPAEGRIEATDTTAWFGFKDDIVIRIRAQGSASRVDVRSKSRVGVSDLGANAERIGRLLDRLREPA
jgi:uncharacterized protein (DUF1499 family)